MKRKCRQAASIACKGIGLGLWNPCVRGRVPLPAWEQRKFLLKDVSAFITKGATPTTYGFDWVDSGIPFFRNDSIKDNMFVYGEYSFISERAHGALIRSEIHAGDILVAITGDIGKVGIVPGEIKKANINQHIARVRIGCSYDPYFVYMFLCTDAIQESFRAIKTGLSMPQLSLEQIRSIELPKVSLAEQRQIGALFSSLDSLITLHQREPRQTKRRHAVLADARPSDLFHQYYRDWITVYKEGAVRNVTLDKYLLTHEWLKRLAPNLQIKDLNRIAYQTILNGYAEKHERQTTMDFHHQMKGAILDAVDDGLIDRDPTRKAIIKGKAPRPKKQKYLNQFELHRLLSVLDLGENISWDWMILLIAKTGLRFSEALAITPEDFDFTKQIVSINKTWDYKNENAFAPTKNPSSNRKVQLDWQLVIQFATLVRELPPQDPIFVKGHVYNATINDALERRCLKAEVPVITIHGLRHTHASSLLFAGVSIASVAKRLGHASMNTTEKTYLHVIRELENKDVDLVMRSISGLI